MPAPAFAEIEFALVRDGDVSFAVLDVVRQFFNIVRPFGMPVDLACLLAQIGLIFAGSAGVHEFERVQNLTEIDCHFHVAAHLT
jgi:hypothetical protein